MDVATYRAKSPHGKQDHASDPPWQLLTENKKIGRATSHPFPHKRGVVLPETDAHDENLQRSCQGANFDDNVHDIRFLSGKRFFEARLFGICVFQDVEVHATVDRRLACNRFITHKWFDTRNW